MSTDILAYVRTKVENEKYYNRRTNLHYFKVGLLVLRKVHHNAREVTAGKLGLNWEGPYRSLSLTEKGSHQLENQNRVKLPRNWNVSQLKVLLLKIDDETESTCCTLFFLTSFCHKWVFLERLLMRKQHKVYYKDKLLMSTGSPVLEYSYFAFKHWGSQSY